MFKRRHLDEVLVVVDHVQNSTRKSSEERMLDAGASSREVSTKQS